MGCGMGIDGNQGDAMTFSLSYGWDNGFAVGMQSCGQNVGIAVEARGNEFNNGFHGFGVSPMVIVSQSMVIHRCKLLILHCILCFAI